MLRFIFIALISTFLCSCATSYLDKTQIPEKIQNRLRQEFRGVKFLRWQKQDKYYMANFRRAKYDYEYIFDKNAAIIQRKEELRLNLMPLPIIEKVKKYYPQYKHRKTILLLQNEKDTFYIAEVQRGMKFYQLKFTTKALYKTKEIILPEDQPLLIDIFKSGAIN